MQIKKKYLRVLIPILFLSYVFLGSFLIYKYKHNSGDDIFSLGFYYGPLIENIVNNGSYNFGIFHAGRMPFIPLFLSVIASIYNNLLFAYLIKNILFLSIIYVCIKMASNHVGNINKYFLCAIFIYCISFPQLLLHTFSLEYGAGYLIPFLTILFVSLIYSDDIKDSRAFIPLAIVNSLTYLARGVTPVLAGLVCFLFWYVTKSRKIFLIFVSSLLATVIAWGTFNFFNSGKFDILVSIKGYNLYKGNNEYALEVYPKYSLDVLSQRLWNEVPGDKLLDEWEADRYFISRYFEFIKRHPYKAAKLFLLKTYEMFIKVTNPVDENSRRYPGLQYMGIVYMLIYRGILFFCLFTAIKSILQGRAKGLLSRSSRSAVSFIYLSFISGYSFFHLIGFAHQRHTVTLVPVSIFYLIWILENRVYKVSLP